LKKAKGKTAFHRRELVN